MDGIPGEAMIEFRYRHLQADTGVVRHPRELFVGVTATFEIVADDQSLYEEDDFPVAELAAALLRWLRDAHEARNADDFEFDSMSTPEPGWVWIRQTEGYWRVGSLHQEFPLMTEFSLGEIRMAVEAFTSSLIDDCNKIFEFDVRKTVSLP